MKHILPLFFIFLMSTGIHAQLVFTPEVDTQDTILDLSDAFISTKMHADIFNNGSSDVVLRWEIFQIDGPEEWQVQLCVDYDYGGCFAWDVNSNLSEDWGTEIPLVVAAGGSSLWEFGMRPNSVGGCGTYEIRVTDTADLNTVLATSTHTFRVNVDPNCEVTSTIDQLSKKNVKIFPNPTNDYFTLTDNNFVKEIQIFNIVGKRMADIPFQNGQPINVASYPNGLYLIRMLDKNGAVLKTTRLTKR